MTWRIWLRLCMWTHDPKFENVTGDLWQRAVRASVLFVPIITSCSIMHSFALLISNPILMFSPLLKRTDASKQGQYSVSTVGLHVRHVTGNSNRSLLHGFPSNTAHKIYIALEYLCIIATPTLRNYSSILILSSKKNWSLTNRLPPLKVSTILAMYDVELVSRCTNRL